MSTKQLYEKTSEGMKEVSPLVSIEDIYSKLSDTPLEALVSLFNHVKCEWKGSVADTRRTVPLFLRRSGLFITYNNGTKYITEFFSAGTDQITTESWVKDSNWTSVPDEDYISAGVKPGVGTIGYEQLNDNLKQLFREKVNVTNFPDDEDIVSVDNMLKFKDREADATKFQSKGYVILRKNLRLVNGVVKNILTQDMINQPNTIYEIRYDFDLGGETIKIPDNCTISENGGSLYNGNIVIGNAKLHGSIIGLGISIIDSHDYIFELSLVKSFKTNFDYAINLSLKYSGVNIPQGTYDMYQSLLINKSSFSIFGNNSIIHFHTNDESGICMNHITPRSSSNVNELLIKDLLVLGTYNPGEYGKGIFLKNTNQVKLTLSNVHLEHFNIALSLNIVINTHILKSSIKKCIVGIINKKNSDVSTSLYIQDSYIAINRKNVILEESSILDIHFINTIMEGAAWSNILDYGNNQLISFDNCYFENNSTGYNINGSYDESIEITNNIYENNQIDSTNFIYQKNCSIVFSNCIINGSNNQSKIDSCIKFNAGKLYMYGCRFSRFKNIISVTSVYNGPNRYVINITGNNFFSSDIDVFNDKSLLKASTDSINIDFFGNYKNNQYKTSSNLFGYADKSIQEGLVNAYGYHGSMINSKALRIEGNNVYYFNKYGTMILGNSENGLVDLLNPGILIPATVDNITKSISLIKLAKLDKLCFLTNINGRFTAILQDSVGNYDYGYLLPTLHNESVLSSDFNGTLLFNKSTKSMEYWNTDSWYNLSNNFKSSLSVKGETRPELSTEIGFQFFDTTLNKPIWWTGTKWVDAIGADV